MADPISLRKDAPAQAAAWYARLRDGRSSLDERAAFDRWLRMDATHGHAWATVERTEQALAMLSASPEIAEMRARALALPSSRAPVRRWAMAAALVAAVGLSMRVAWPDRTPPSTMRKTGRVASVDYASARGERRVIVLSDGSGVTLDTQSHIRVALAGSERRVTLVAGQAFFQVAHDAAHPFVVRAGDVAVTALGTAFGVRADRAHVSVALLRGKVRVALPMAGKQAFLEPGTSLVASGAILVKSAVIPGNATEWMQDRLRFDATPMSSAIAEMNRYGGPKLVLGDPAPEDRQISGVFRTDGAAQLAHALASYRIARIGAQSTERIILVHY